MMSTDQLPGRAYAPSPRITRLRAEALASPPDRHNNRWLRAYHYLCGWMAADGDPLPLRNAAGLASVVANMPATLAAPELLVGRHFMNGEPPYPNFHRQSPADLREQIARSGLAPAEQAQLIAWLEQDPFAFMGMAPVEQRPEEIRTAQAHGVLEVWGTDLNHSIRAYEKVLRLGFLGLRAQVEDALAGLPLTAPDAPLRRATLRGWLRLCDAAAELGTRHAAQARALAAACEDPPQRQEWETIADICDRVPAHPARTFREALQALWFAHMITAWEDGTNANGMGRIDQFLWPYLEADLAAGRTTWAEAAEHLAALWIKLYQSYDTQQMTIGGLRPDGSDAVTPLSYLALAITEGLGFVRCLSARLHRGTPPAFVSRCLDLVARGGGIPFFFNDEALIPALTANGIPLEDARDYAPIGCIETTIPGRANPHAVSHWVNLAKVLELALNDGRDLRDGTQLGPHTGTLAEFTSIEQVRAAYTQQLAHVLPWAIYGSNADELAHRAQFRLPYLSLLTDDCVSRGLDIIDGGARYNFHGSAAMGLPNVADSLTALEVAVFREGRISGAALLQALREDFAGQEDVRLYLRNRVPKYGNGDPLPDGYAAELAHQYCTEVGRYRTPSGGRYFGTLFTYTLMLPYGKLTAASPDGRHAGEPLAYSVSPVQGRDREGLTAVMRSLAALPHHLVAASSSAIIEADPALLEGPGRDAFRDLLLTAIDQGVGQLQFNVVSAETLRAAQRDPDRYRSLCVRVSGFSQQFNLLDREMQEHIIARTKHRR